MEKYQMIKAAVFENISIRDYSKQTGISRNTISKYVRMYQELIKKIISKPQYDGSNRKKRVITEEMMVKIKHYLKENEIKRKTGRSKQQKKISDIHQCLTEVGFSVSYTTVCRIVRALEDKPKEAYIKQIYEFGDVCEFDWGEIKLEINGEMKALQMAVFTSAKGNYRFAKLYLIFRLTHYDKK